MLHFELVVVVVIIVVIVVVVVVVVLLQEGDKIKVISRVNDNWVRGELGGAQGMFPADFVDSVPDSLPLVSEKTKDQVSLLNEYEHWQLSMPTVVLDVLGFVTNK